MRVNYFGYFLLLWLASMSYAFAQSKEAIIAKLDSVRNTVFQEKVYLHTDRTNYLTGETIWLAAYCADASYHRLSSVSKVLYVDLIDSKGDAVAQHAMELNNGIGQGSIYLPATISSGYYALRGYTQWMQNFDAGYFFQQTIAIVNPFKLPDTPVPITNSDPHIRFAPAAGEMVEGLVNTVGFSLTAQDGSGLQLPGVVRNNKNDTIVRLTPDANGMGSFELRPVAGEHYHATVANGKALLTFKLPDAVAQGITMHVAQNEASVSVSIHGSSQYVNTTVTVLIHTRQQVVVLEQMQLTDGRANLSISTEKIPAGVSHIAVFDHQLRMRCEQSLFIAPVKSLDIKTAGVQPSYQKREKVSFSFSTTQAAHLSISVILKDEIPAPTRLTLPQHLMFASDLAEPIEVAPARGTFTLPLVTQTENRFSWDKSFSKKIQPAVLPEFRGPLIRARVEDVEGRPVAGVSAFLASPDSVVQLSTAITNQEGIAYFQPGRLRGERKWVLQMNNHADSLLRIRFLNNFSTAAPPKALPDLVLSPTLEQAILQRSIAMQSQNIYYADEMARTNPIETNGGDFYGAADERYRLDDYTRFPVMEEVMREYVSGVWVRKRKDGFHFLVHDDLNKVVMQETPLMLVDGVPFFDEDEIMAFDPLKVKTLEVVNRKYFLGAQSFPGIVSLKTYTGDLAGLPLHKRAVSANFEAIQQERIFYTARHDSQPPASNLPDLRTTLFWKAGINAPAGQEQTIEFFTSDLSGEFEVVIQGLSANGVPGFQSFTFKVVD